VAFVNPALKRVAAVRGPVNSNVCGNTDKIIPMIFPTGLLLWPFDRVFEQSLHEEISFMPSIEDILKSIHDAVVAYDEEGVKKAAELYIDEGHDALRGITDGLAAGMATVGDLFKAQEYYVPEVLLCAEAMQAGLDILTPHLRAGDSKSRGRVVLGTIQGDIHDIGKNIVKLMLEISGFTVYDLGTNVPYQLFVDELVRTEAELVGISAMMTTTMMGMKKVIQLVREARPEVGILIGGAPVSREIVKMFKADGFALSASDVVDEVKRVLALRTA
jgi:methanogenic corrinoid protein MtbC1